MPPCFPSLVKREEPRITQSGSRPVRGAADSRWFAAGPVNTAAVMDSGVITLGFGFHNKRAVLTGNRFSPNNKAAGLKAHVALAQRACAHLKRTEAAGICLKDPCFLCETWLSSPRVLLQSQL